MKKLLLDTNEKNSKHKLGTYEIDKYLCHVLTIKICYR